MMTYSSVNYGCASVLGLSVCRHLVNLFNVIFSQSKIKYEQHRYLDVLAFVGWIPALIGYHTYNESYELKVYLPVFLPVTLAQTHPLSVLHRSFFGQKQIKNHFK